jgi:hypothetical protein
VTGRMPSKSGEHCLLLQSGKWGRYWVVGYLKITAMRPHPYPQNQ